MSIPRLTFLYPLLFKSNIATQSSCALQLLYVPTTHTQKSRIHTTKSRKQETFPQQRYGTATEPPPGMPPESKPNNEDSLAGAIEKEVTAPTKKDEQKHEAVPATKEVKKEASKKSAKPDDRPESDQAASPEESTEAKAATTFDISTANPKQLAEESERNREKAMGPPLETVLQMGPPPPETEHPEEHPEEQKAPHLQAPPYVHHFDTYSLVKDLEKGGFTIPQAVTIMKAVRGRLAINLDVAKEGLVSKSDVENETYLFRAACSELRTEILNTRKSSITKTRTQLSHLQHTYDILSQRTTQETLALKDDLRGMLNDRRMAVRDQQQSRDSEISELHYKISVALNSDAKSVVEGLRWFLTRRAAIGIMTMALLILGSLRYSSYKLHEREIEARKRGLPPTAAEGSSTDSGGGGAGHTVPSREMGTQTSEKDEGIDKAVDVGYTSLG